MKISDTEYSIGDYVEYKETIRKVKGVSVRVNEKGEQYDQYDLAGVDSWVLASSIDRRVIIQAGSEKE